MATYSLASGLFFLDADSEVRHDPVAALESIATAGFSETERWLKAMSGRIRVRTTRGPCREALERFKIFPHTIHTPMSGVNLASSIEEIRRDSVTRIGEAMRFSGSLADGLRLCIQQAAPVLKNHLTGWRTSVQQRSVSTDL